MASDRPSKPDVVTYGDHEIITPDTRKLRKLLRPALPGEDDPVARAEEALATISGDFSEWMLDECARLDAARRKVKATGYRNKPARSCSSPPTTSRAIPARSDIRKWPRPPTACAGCWSTRPISPRIPLAIVDQHVDAVRAIVREHKRPDVAAIAAALTSKLRAVTDEFLVRKIATVRTCSRRSEVPRWRPASRSRHAIDKSG